MLLSNYVEDIFVEFFENSLSSNIPIQQQDRAACDSFYQNIKFGHQLTQNQANYVIKILEKYKKLSAIAGFDYELLITDPIWKNSFRTIDYSKKVFVEKDSSATTYVCLKFPYQLKKEFENEFEGKNHKAFSIWDPDEKIRKLNLYEFNLIQIYEFVKKHNFEIDDSFMIALGEVEEIWQEQDQILPKSIIVDGRVQLVNALPEVIEWWEQNSKGTIEDDLLLAKNMGYILNKTPANIVEKIAVSTSNSFWIKTNEELLDICKHLTGKICIVLDRVGRSVEWIQNFSESIDQAGISRDLVKVCFRADKNENQEFNQWIKDNGFGGKVENGQILIFNYKPAKWLFKELNSVTMLVSNNLYPSTNTIARDWFQSHPCVVYLGDIKPSESRGQKIVEL